MVENKTTHIRKKEKRLRIPFEIDIEKVYTFVDWGFVGFLFDKMGFDDRWKR